MGFDKEDLPEIFYMDKNRPLKKILLKTPEIPVEFWIAPGEGHPGVANFDDQIAVSKSTNDLLLTQPHVLWEPCTKPVGTFEILTRYEIWESQRRHLRLSVKVAAIYADRVAITSDYVIITASFVEVALTTIARRRRYCK